MSAFLRTLLLCTLPAWTSAVKHSGYIYDRLCIERGVGIDGVDGRRQPERHTVHCLLVSICQNSGFGILTKPSGADLWSFEVLFSDRGNADVITWLGTQEYWGTEVQVEVEGSYDGSGKLHVDSIKRLNDGSVWQGRGAGGTTSTSTPGTTSTTTLGTPNSGSSTTGPPVSPSATSGGGPLWQLPWLVVLLPALLLPPLA
ncbi:CPK8 [Symbiodinium sp. CCMP2592]|nr:CPK8 [Symbiodinium sp. CCMP2592]